MSPAVSLRRRESLLDRVIRRTEAQRDLLARLAAEAPDGPVLELGLGNGRTYDHLREALSGREVFAFDRAITAAPASLPDAAHLVLGDLRDTLPFVAPRIGRPAALIHADLSSGDPTLDLSIADWLARLAPPLLGPGGLLAASVPLAPAGLASLDWPEARAAAYTVHRR
jgi:trans-aconitate methyltransferase